jgi:homoaconitase/3-isopropylmalate dehydratase large subunit
MLNVIKKLPVEAQKDFREVVVASLDGREPSTDSRFIMTELAIAGGYENELIAADGKTKAYKAFEVKDIQVTKQTKKKKGFFGKSKVNTVE